MSTPLTANINPFCVLSVAHNATDEEIRAAYFREVREHRPDVDPEGFKRIRTAFESIKDQESRNSHWLNCIHPSPTLDQALGPIHARPDAVTHEDLRRVVLSLTELSRTGFRGDCRDLEGLLDALEERT